MYCACYPSVCLLGRSVLSYDVALCASRFVYLSTYLWIDLSICISTCQSALVCSCAYIKYVCVCIYIYIYMYTYISVDIHRRCVYEGLHVCVCVCACAYKDRYSCTCKSANSELNKCRSMPAYRGTSMSLACLHICMFVPGACLHVSPSGCAVRFRAVPSVCLSVYLFVSACLSVCTQACIYVCLLV